MDSVRGVRMHNIFKALAAHEGRIYRFTLRSSPHVLR